MNCHCACPSEVLTKEEAERSAAISIHEKAGFAILEIVIAVGILAALSFGGFYAVNNIKIPSGLLNGTSTNPVQYAKQTTDLFTQAGEQVQNQVTELNTNNSKLITNTSASSTANWKTYRNDTYGFEFKYPEDWEQLSRDGETYLRISSSSFIHIGIFQNGWYPDPDTTTSEVVINGVQAERADDAYLITGTNNSFYVELRFYSEEATDRHFLEDIVSTLKFTK